MDKEFLINLYNISVSKDKDDNILAINILKNNLDKLTVNQILLFLVICRSYAECEDILDVPNELPGTYIYFQVFRERFEYDQEIDKPLKQMPDAYSTHFRVIKEWLSK